MIIFLYLYSSHINTNLAGHSWKTLPKSFEYLFSIKHSPPVDLRCGSEKISACSFTHLAYRSIADKWIVLQE